MEEEKNKEQISKKNMGMIFGIILGSILATLLFIFTNNALSFTLVGIFLVFGLIFGTLWENQSSNS